MTVVLFVGFIAAVYFISKRMRLRFWGTVLLSVCLSVVLAALSFALEINEGGVSFVSHLPTALGAGLVVGLLMASVFEGIEPKRENE